jgi:RNA polymerase sigma-70 factor (ECF subfamily)
MNGQPMARTIPVAVVERPVERLTALFDAHHERLYRLARRLAPTMDDALDLVQETFLKAARTPKSLPVGMAQEEAWLVRILINVQRDQWRQLAVRKRHKQSEFIGGQEANGGQDQEAALIAQTTIWRALDLLPPRRRAILVMHELDGLEIANIASILGISAVTVRWHLSIGRRDLARVLKPSNGRRQ